MKISILNTIAASAVFAAVTSYTITSATAAPAASEDIVAVASGNSDFSTLVAALTAAELVEALQGAGPFTVFAPNNAAFAKLPAGTVDDLLKPENKAKLTAILKNHVVSGKVMAADVKAGPVPTLGGGDVVIAVEGGGVKYGDAMVIGTDVLASNGVIHVIDTVVVPD
ncbi:MAG: fasciclin domain-containing protein [Verrucomicrobia bacterium]|nr:fasciclin domain-containing protein [Verrucomicrobiota bacterium]